MGTNFQAEGVNKFLLTPNFGVKNESKVEVMEKGE